MGPLLSTDQLKKVKFYIFRNGRLLDRQLFDFFFGHGSREACLKALFAYQNTDGGFGNALEPDITCPESSAICAETALYTLDLLDCHAQKYLRGLVNWIKSNMTPGGYITHPPKSLHDYPHQPWWEAPDKERIFAVAGILKQSGYEDPGFYEKVRAFYNQFNLPDADMYYSYPYLVYLKYCGINAEDKAKLSVLARRIPALLEEHRSFFPLFNRLWYHACDLVEAGMVDQATTEAANAFQEDGGIRNPYPDLPWWRPIKTVNCLVLLKKRGYL